MLWIVPTTLAIATLLDARRPRRLVRYGADPSGGTDGPIDDLVVKLGQLKEVATEEALERFAEIDAQVEAEIKRTVRNAPAEIFDIVADTAIDAAARAGRQDMGEELQRFKLRIHPKDVGEVREAMGAIKTLIKRSPAVRQVTDRAIELLDEHGVITGGILSDLITVLAASAAGYKEIERIAQGGDVRIVTPLGSLSVNRLGKYSARFQLPVFERKQYKDKVAGLVSQAVNISAKGSVTADVPVKRVEISLPTSFQLGRHRRRGSVSPYAILEPDRGERTGRREAGVKLTLPI